MQFKNSNSLPLPVLVIGGAIIGGIAAFIAVHLLSSLAWIAGPILGALWGLSMYKRPR